MDKQGSPKVLRTRLDVRCVELGLAPTRHAAQALILAGEIYVNGNQETKAGTRISAAAALERRGKGLDYVSRGGIKLAAALDRFDIDPTDLCAIDIGASTGGFTDCLLQRNAKHVVALDVGYGQLAWRLRQDPRVTVLERTNIRHITTQQLIDAVPHPDCWPPQIAVIDVSFISLQLVLPHVRELLRPQTPIVALLKPQFEAGRDRIGKGGVVRDMDVRDQTIAEVKHFAEDNHFSLAGSVDSPIKGPKGNLEHWLHLETLAS